MMDHCGNCGGYEIQGKYEVAPDREESHDVVHEMCLWRRDDQIQEAGDTP